jgi:hypothetical protein
VSCEAIAESVDSSPRQRVLFAGTQSDASAARRRLMADCGVGVRDVAVKEVDVPTDKQGLLAFLNAEAGWARRGGLSGSAAPF